jgi:DnaJ-class molecular chaperone
MAGPRGGRPGDLFVQVELEPVAHLRREGREVFAETTIPLGVALPAPHVIPPAGAPPAQLATPGG